MIPESRFLIRLHRSARQHLRAIPQELRKHIIERISGLTIEPYPHDVKILRGKRGSHREPVQRIRAGDYRILYVVRQNPKEIIILDVDHRKDVYR